MFFTEINFLSRSERMEIRKLAPTLLNENRSRTPVGHALTIFLTPNITDFQTFHSDITALNSQHSD